MRDAWRESAMLFRFLAAQKKTPRPRRGVFEKFAVAPNQFYCCGLAAGGCVGVAGFGVAGFGCAPVPALTG